MEDSTVVPKSDLLRKALEHVLEQRALFPEKSVTTIVDEAAMRFNLSPLDADALGRLVAEETGGEKKA
ncbi:MAG: hypothetical protein LBR22_10025 [Desulfovibrio sp.]|jgi:hypothetical protein|nr:hypothetical protein [Desulfovibrio sp.]